MLDVNRLWAMPVFNTLWVGVGVQSWLALMGKLFPASNKTPWKPIVGTTFSAICDDCEVLILENDSSPTILGHGGCLDEWGGRD